jgi:ATP-binding cassette, subfamily B, bacterial
VKQVGITVYQKDPEREQYRKSFDLPLFKRIFRYAQTHKKNLFLLLICVVTRSCQVPLLAWSLSSIIKGPIKDGDLHRLIWGVSGYAALGIFTNWVLYYRQLLALRLGEASVHDMRNDVFSHVQSLTMSFFHTTKLGRIISRFTSDVEAVRVGLQNVVFVSIVSLGQFTIATCILMYTDLKLFTVMLATSPLYFLTYRYFKQRMIDANRVVQESFSRLTANLAESVTGIRVTQGYVRQDRNAALFKELVDDHATYNMGVVKANGTFSPMVELVSSVITAAIFLIGGYWALHPISAAGLNALIVFYFLANEVLQPLANLGNQYTQAVVALTGAERVFRVLDRQPDFTEPPDAMDLPPIQGRVEFRQLNFEYVPGRPVLRGINFVAEPGQTIALVGHTGSGKSSILNLISKFYLPTSGELLIDGHEIRRIKAKSLHHQMGIVLQVNFLFTGTVLDNILVGRPGATEAEVRDAAKKLDVLDLLDAMPQGLKSMVGERGGGMSMGQRQVICFTRAMLANPRIMILDEATSSVDTLTEGRIQTALQILLKGRTCFVVAHRLSTIRYADIVLVLDHGRIIERGSHIELLTQGGVYTELYSQFVETSHDH